MQSFNRKSRKPGAARRGVLAPAAVLGLAALVVGLGAGGAYDEERPDPVKANGTIFKEKDGADWPKPTAVLVFTGEQDGYLEPCGCAGLTNQKGGLKRRHTFLKQLRDDGWPVVALDAGGLIKRYGQQAQIKYNRAVNALIELGYQGVGFGAKDLRMEVLGVAINLEESRNPLTSANVGLLGFDPLMSQRWRTAEAGGLKIGFTSVLADRLRAVLENNPDVDSEPAAEALKRVTPELEAQGCDHLVLMVYGNGDEARRLAKQFPAYRWVVSAAGADEPPHRIEKIAGASSYHVEVGHKGMYAVAIGLYPGGDPAFRYQKVPLDHRFDDSPQMQRMLIEYQDELKTFGFDGLGVKPQLHPSATITRGTFAGSAACADCHEEEYEIWQNTPHSHGTKTIVDLEPARHFDPECLSCHVTGWEPQKYYPFVSGYVSLEATPHLTEQGCENCHGPGARHAAVENGDIDVPDSEREALYAALHLEIGENEGNKEGQALGKAVNNCLGCHDLDNSPDFDFQEYWQVVKHGSRWERDEEEAEE
ncbi:MAG: multiheme c-type cytochrome [Planctomycetota bacterium]